MLSTLNIRSDTHNSCEDRFFVKEDEEYVRGVIADGCSSGTNSDFAAQLLCYAFQDLNQRTNEGWTFTENLSMRYVKNRMRSTMDVFNTLTDMNFLCTAIVFEYNKISKRLSIRTLGDCYYWINDIEYKVDQNNTPDYMGYYLNNIVAFESYLDKYPVLEYENVEKFIITSDGIEKISKSTLQVQTNLDPLALLLAIPTSPTYLKLKWNLIKRDKFTLSDDLTIISYVNNQS